MKQLASCAVSACLFWAEFDPKMSSPGQLAKVLLSLAAGRQSMDFAPEALLLDLVGVPSLPVCS
jgi:hypothetical protein